MKKLNATNAIVIVSLGLTLSVVVAGCGGNDSAESAVTKNAKAGSSDGGAGGDSTKSATSNTAKAGSSDGGAGGGSTTVAASAPGSSDGGAGGGSTTIAASAAGSADGGTGESVTVSDADLYRYSKDYSNLTPAQINSITSEQWSSWVYGGGFSASQVAAFPTKLIQNLPVSVLSYLSTAATQALTNDQLKSMSKDQLNALKSPSNKSTALTDEQLNFVNARLKTLG